MNHRGLQRALFRMHLDPEFAARLRARDASAETSTALGEAELAWLRAADPAAVAADRDGRRRAQLLSNVAGEFALSCAVARASDADWLDAFPASPHFHRAIAEDLSLPLAFAAYAQERAARISPRLATPVALESALARARRTTRGSRDLPKGTLVLATTAWLVELPDGVFAWAVVLRQALDRGEPLPAAALAPAPESETVLVTSTPAATPMRLRDAHAERLEPLVAAFLRACETGLAERDVAALAARHRIDLADVEGVAADFLADGILARA